MNKKYPWKKWMSGGVTAITRGIDYHCSQSTMVQMIRNKASLLGLKLSIHDTGAQIYFSVVGKRGGNSEVPHTNSPPLVS